MITCWYQVEREKISHGTKEKNANMYDNVTKKLISLWIPRDLTEFFLSCFAFVSQCLRKQESAVVEITVVCNFTKKFFSDK